MRTFLSIPIPDELKNKIAEFQNKIKPLGKIKLVEKENIHLTLKFLGDVRENKIPGIIENLKIISENKDNKKFKIKLCGAGAFPNMNYIKILWIGVSESYGSDEVLSLHEQVDEQLTLLKFKKDNKFHPHATIARIKFLNTKDKKELKDMLCENLKTDFGDFEVPGFELMKSELTTRGSIYFSLKQFEFV
ncbi:MAG: RNA 2',3'-cyclic phosphodiesterase [Candidatus Altiarchaeales archaeon HGW-Altiarchaeales-3]|nr:MAG: RNA 2',3'-cyclic phosphodiesterase [Candidatus Altiarchaeales archaeon HGW-Altiarchaeales-3]